MACLTLTSLFALLTVSTFYSDQIDAQPRSRCPRGWKQQIGNCYTVGRHRQTWFEAERSCKAMGGHVASIKSFIENSVIRSVMDASRVWVAWIGATDLAEEGRFVSTGDGQPLQYTNWVTGEPNNANGKENCVVFFRYNHKWSDDVCTKHNYYICKKPVSI